MKIKPYPLLMEPFLESKIWGGSRLISEFAKDRTSDGPLGESWEVSDIPSKESKVSNGPLKGKKMLEALSLIDEKFDKFPLLVKFINAEQDLSIQVHPSEKTIHENGLQADPKDECWYVLNTDSHSRNVVYHGLKDGVSSEDFKKAVRENSVIELMRPIPISRGKVIHVPPGTPHAILSGTTLLEIQQPSDTTYRVYDYGRKGLNGKPRELHIEKALKSISFGNSWDSIGFETCELSTDENFTHNLLLKTEHYRVERIQSDSSFEIKNISPELICVICTEGEAEICSEENIHLNKIQKGQTVLLPSEEIPLKLKTENPIELIVASHINCNLVDARKN